VNARRDLIRNIVASSVIVAITLGTTWLAISFGKLTLIGVIGAIALAVAAYIGVRHPLWLFYSLAVVMAGLQYARIPGINLPFYLPIAFGIVVAGFFHPRLARSMHPLEFAWLALILASGLTMVVMAQSFIDYSLYIRWTIAAMVLFALVQLPRENLARFGQIIAVVAALNGIFGMYMIAFDPNQNALNFLRPFGYLPEYTMARFAYGAEGGSGSIRLGGTWVEPNGAALNLVIALALASLLFVDWRRTVLVLVITTALLLTLSRGSIFSVVAGVLLVLVFHAMRTRDRAATIGVIAIVAAGALLTAPIRERLLSAFAGDDVGSTARADALRVFPGQMSGHWGFGHGWGRPEFIDPQYSYIFNLPSNAPLITLYRGGLVPFLAFMAVVLIGCLVAYRAVRSDSLNLAMYGGIFIGIVVVQFNLDHNVADVPQAVLLYSIILAFLIYTDELRKDRVKAKSVESSSPPTPAVLTVPS